MAANVLDVGNLTDAEIFEVYKSNKEEYKSDVQFTNQRKDYEIYRVAENEGDLNELHELEGRSEPQATTASSLLSN